MTARLTMTVLIRIEPLTLAAIDANRGDVPRSVWIRNALAAALADAGRDRQNAPREEDS